MNEKKLAIHFFNLRYVIFGRSTYLPCIFIVTLCHIFDMTYLPQRRYGIIESFLITNQGSTTLLFTSNAKSINALMY